MKVYINGKFLCQQTTGVQNYALGIMRALRFTGIDFQVIVPNTLSMNQENHAYKIGVFKNLILWEQLDLFFFMRKQKNALLLNFCNSAPLLYFNQIVCIHDLAFEQKNKNWFSPIFKLWYRFLIPRLCQKAKLVFTISEFSKSEIMRQYGIPELKIKIVPNGLKEVQETDVRQVNEDYLLVLGGNNPRKNVQWVIDQMDEIEKAGLKLVVLNSDTKVFGESRIGTHPSLIELPYVSQSRYLSLLKHSKALIYPSLYEGFGIPLLESLCLQTPVICNDLGVFRESFGTLPIYVDLKNKIALKEALKKLMYWSISDSEITELKNKFDFNTSASLIVNFLKELPK